MLLMSENCEWNTDTTVIECNTDTKLKKDFCVGTFLHSRNQEVPEHIIIHYYYYHSTSMPSG